MLKFSFVLGNYDICVNSYRTRSSKRLREAFWNKKLNTMSYFHLMRTLIIKLILVLNNGMWDVGKRHSEKNSKIFRFLIWKASIKRLFDVYGKKSNQYWSNSDSAVCRIMKIIQFWPIFIVRVQIMLAQISMSAPLGRGNLIHHSPYLLDSTVKIESNLILSDLALLNKCSDLEERGGRGVWEAFKISL